MTINITNRTGAQNTTKNNTETKHTHLSYHTDSCMAHLNCLPLKAASINYWFFLLAHQVMDVGIKQTAKGEKLLRKIDVEMNVKNGGFPPKLRNGDGGDMRHD